MPFASSWCLKHVPGQGQCNDCAQVHGLVAWKSAHGGLNGRISCVCSEMGQELNHWMGKMMNLIFRQSHLIRDLLFGSFRKVCACALMISSWCTSDLPMFLVPFLLQYDTPIVILPLRWSVMICHDGAGIMSGDQNANVRRVWGFWHGVAAIIGLRSIGFHGILSPK
jgi:hypothetical protein